MNDINIVRLDDFHKQRLVFLCLPGLETFSKDIVTSFSEDYIVETCYSKSLSALEEAIDRADLVWIEWANELAIELTRKVVSLESKKVIIRLHSYEALSGFVQYIKWSVVDVLIFVAEHIKRFVLQQLPGLGNPAMNPPELYVVPNGVRV